MEMVSAEGTESDDASEGELTSLPFAKKKFLSLPIQRYESKSVNAILRFVANKIIR